MTRHRFAARLATHLAVLVSIIVVACTEPMTATSTPLHIDTDSFTLAWGTSRRLTSDAQPATWSSSDSAIAAVDNSGTVTARRAGSAIIRAQVGSRSAEVKVTVNMQLVDIAGGTAHTCAVDVSHHLLCWGADDHGQLAIRSNGSPFWVATPAPTDTLFHRVVSGGGGGENIEGGFSCGLSDDGHTYCWGTSESGQAGMVAGTFGQGSPDTVRVLPGAPAFASLAAGDDHACGLTPSGAAFCWGQGETLGNPDAQSKCMPGRFAVACSITPIAVLGNIAFAMIAAGGTHNCGVDAGGRALCWGSNASGQLGADSVPLISCPGGCAAVRYAPVPVMTDRRFTTLAAGFAHTCAISIDGGLWCWGANDSGQLGAPNRGTLELLPIRVQAAVQLVSLVAGSLFTCGLTADGVAYCWGDNTLGQLGDGTIVSRAAPAAVRTAARFARLTAGSNHVCGLTAQGEAYCWGANNLGQLGNGTIVSSSVPVPVSAPTVPPPGNGR